jgi:dihydroflavonol-4-reductase
MTDNISFVTGGAGFIGRHLVRQLVEQGEHVKVLDIDCGSEPLPKETEVVEGSVLDAPLVGKMMRGARRVYHLAANPNLWARNKSSFHQTNFEGTRAVLQAAHVAGVERVIYTSTETILKENAKTDGPIHEDVHLPGLSDMPGAYCKSKNLAERAALEAASAGLPVVVVNPTLPVGPGDWKLTPPTRMLQGFLTGTFPAYLQCQLNLVPVEDVARGHILAAEKGRVGERYILSGENVMLSQFLFTLERLTGQAMPKHCIPYWLAFTAGTVDEFVSDYFTHKPPTAPLAGVRLARSFSMCQSIKARTELGFEAGSLDAALVRAIAWLSESEFLKTHRKGKQITLPFIDGARKRLLGTTTPN